MSGVAGVGLDRLTDFYASVPEPIENDGQVFSLGWDDGGDAAVRVVGDSDHELFLRERHDHHACEGRAGPRRRGSDRSSTGAGCDEGS